MEIDIILQKSIRSRKNKNMAANGSHVDDNASGFFFTKIPITNKRKATKREFLNFDKFST